MWANQERLLSCRMVESNIHWPNLRDLLPNLDYHHFCPLIIIEDFCSLDVGENDIVVKNGALRINDNYFDLALGRGVSDTFDTYSIPVFESENPREDIPERFSKTGKRRFMTMVDGELQLWQVNFLPHFSLERQVYLSSDWATLEKVLGNQYSSFREHVESIY
jgi:hypothetical protein